MGVTSIYVAWRPQIGNNPRCFQWKTKALVACIIMHDIQMYFTRLYIFLMESPLPDFHPNPPPIMIFVLRRSRVPDTWGWWRVLAGCQFPHHLESGPGFQGHWHTGHLLFSSCTPYMLSIFLSMPASNPWTKRCKSPFIFLTCSKYNVLPHQYTPKPRIC